MHWPVRFEEFRSMEVRTLCLGILSLKDATGYEIKKMCEDGAFSHFLDASFGSIYPALNKLRCEGLVSFRQEAQEKRPAKKIYSITERGKRAFQEALLQPLMEDKYRSDFLFVSLFADQMPRERMKVLIDQQIDWMKNQANFLAEGIEDSQSPGAQFVTGFGQASTQAIINYLEKNRALLEQAASRQTVLSPERVTEDV